MVLSLRALHRMVQGEASHHVQTRLLRRLATFGGETPRNDTMLLLLTHYGLTTKILAQARLQ